MVVWILECRARKQVNKKWKVTKGHKGKHNYKINRK